MSNQQTEKLAFHKGQRPIVQAILNEPTTRFVTAAAGRQGGKTFLVRNVIPLEAAKDENAHGDSLRRTDVLYVAPSLRLAKDLVWDELVETCLGMGLCTPKGVKLKDLQIHTENQRKIILLGADNPNSLRGYTASLVCVDEAKDIKRDAIIKSLIPVTSVPKGTLVMIGTPEGKGGVFYEFYKKGMMKNPGFKSFTFTSFDNPLQDKGYLEMMRGEMAEHIFAQEFEASFQGAGGNYFKREHFKILSEGEFNQEVDGAPRYIAIDLAGFTESDDSRLDSHVIAVVAVNEKGWFVEDMIHGKWGPRETAFRITQAYKDYRPIHLGIEKGSLKNAIGNYLTDYSRKFGVYFDPEGLKFSQGSKKDRIMIELLGRAQHKRLFLKKAEWNAKLLDEADDFPSPLAHDDMLDALAYIGQLAHTQYSFGGSLVPEDEVWEPYDEYSGF